MRALSKAGDLVTIGNTTNYPVTRTTHGLLVADPGVPLLDYTPQAMDPLTMWKKHPSLRKVVSFAARNVASIKWHAYLRESDTDRTRQADSNAEYLLNSPSRFVTGYHFWHDLVVDNMLYDCWAFTYTGTELVRIPPFRLVISSNFLGVVTRIQMRVEAGTRNADRDNLVDITDWPLAIGWGWAPAAAGGVSPLHTLGDILEESTSSVAWRKSQWKNSPRFNSYVRRPPQSESGAWDDRKRTRFVESMANWRSMPDNTPPPVLEDGMEFREMPKGPNAAETQNIEGRQLTDQEVASAYHIPPELVGARQGNFSNMQAFRQMLFGPTLGPLFREFEQAVNQMMIPHLDTRSGLYAEMDREAALNGTFMEQAVVMSRAIGGPWLTRNEGRAVFNRPGLEGGDELITPLNVTQGGQANPSDSGEQNETGAEKQQLIEHPAGNRVEIDSLAKG